MGFKDKESHKAYYRKYYKEHKEEYAERCKLRYWRKKALSLGEPKSHIELLNLNQLQSLCAEHIN